VYLDENQVLLVGQHGDKISGALKSIFARPWHIDFPLSLTNFCFSLTHRPSKLHLSRRHRARRGGQLKLVAGWVAGARTRAALGCKLNYSLHPSASRAIEVRAIKPLSATPSGKSTHAGNKHH
jgi:hypothetical protein